MLHQHIYYVIINNIMLLIVIINNILILCYSYGMHNCIDYAKYTRKIANSTLHRYVFNISWC